MNSPWHLYHKTFCVSLHIDNFTLIAYAQERHPESLCRPKKCKRDSGNSDCTEGRHT